MDRDASPQAVYAIEQLGSDRHVIDKHAALAVVQKAKATSSTASVCVVDVPPVTSYRERGSSGDASKRR
jgi:hypothetical protein